jgi:dihydroorotase-like cyclic amidohydrolase
MMLDAAAKGKISLERVVGCTATDPARIFGLATKGRIEVGMDADIAIADLDKEWQITDEGVLSRIGWTPYAGMQLRGAIERTLVRGAVVYEDGKVTGAQGWGKQARPSR